MIHVVRPRRNSKLFNSPEFLEVERELRAFFEKGGTRKTAQLEPLERGLRAIRRLGLAEVHRAFDNRCAYTEVHEGFDRGRMQLTWHRPPSDAESLDGQVAPDHYWWLITEWPNWYLVSPHTIQLKGNLFPVVGKRSKARDAGVLLDPCRDRPEWHLRFDARGGVSAVEDLEFAEGTKLAGVPRGEHTIRLLDLNRKTLVGARAVAIENARSTLRASDWQLESVRHLPHLGAIRQVLAALLTSPASPQELRVPRRGRADLARELAPELAARLMTSSARLLALGPAELDVRHEIAEYVPEVLRDTARFERHFSEETAPVTRKKKARPRVTTAVPIERPERPPVVMRSHRISRVVIENFRAIRRVELDVSSEQVYLRPPYGSAQWKERFDAGESFDATSQEPAAPWLALLGENGSGKSSILQAIALALCGRNDRVAALLDTAGVSWSQLLRRSTPGEPDVRRGSVRVEFGEDTVLQLDFDATGGTFTQEHDVQLRVRGYGAIRLLESQAAKLMPSMDVKAQYSEMVAQRETEKIDPDAAADRPERDVRLANLFNPTVPVIDAGQWLLELDGELFNIARATLARLLGAGEEDPGGDEQLITRMDGTIYVGADPLSQVSDGYRAVIAMASDIMAGLGDDMSNLTAARGLVLIDEIGANLHPRWRMQITQRLRHALPNVQFLISTHEPLCLRGLEAGEVWAVLRFEPHGVFCEQIERSPSAYRVDQLLTSEFFGLQTAVDPDVDARYRAYNQLIVKARDPNGKLDDFESRQLEDLRRFFATEHRPRLGSTRRDMLVYEAIDNFLGAEATLPPDERAARRREVLLRVRDIWAGSMRQRGLTEVPR